MNALDPSSSAALDDAALTQRVATLARNERKHLVEFLRSLGEFDARKLYLGLGYPNMYEYCRDGLKLSDGAAFRRYSVARLMLRFPVIAQFLEDGRLNLSRLKELRDVLTPENHLDLLNRATRGTEKDVEALAASLRPKPDAKDSIRKVSDRPVPSPAPQVTLEPATTAAATTPAAGPSASTTPAAPTQAGAPVGQAPIDASIIAVGATALSAADREPEHLDPHARTSTVEVQPSPRARRMEVEATSGTAFSVRMRVGREFLAEFEAVKAELSHKFPDGNFEDIFRECFRITLEALHRRRAPKPRQCRANKPSQSAAASSEPSPKVARSEERAPSRFIPADVERVVRERDGGRCAYVGATGKRCNSRHQVQLHHLIPFASGGPSTPENLSLRCRAHNLYEAELAFGPEFMRAKISAPRAAAATSTSGSRTAVATSASRGPPASSHFHHWK